MNRRCPEPNCDHDDSAHDSELGCLFPGCRCKETRPSLARASVALRAANEGPSEKAYGVPPRPARLGVGEKARLFFAMTGLGVPIGLVIAVGLVALVLLLACGKFPKEVDPRYNSPSPTVDYPMNTGRQDPPK